ncbi:MAG: hypothetical protein ACYSWU_06275 [Planctomycetota bacterium]|jgi:hypothetical protein
MLGKSARLIAAVAALAAVTALTLVPAEDLGRGPVPQEGVLLLHNGEAIEGRVSRVGELYYVALPRGEIRVRAADVEFWCRDLHEGYRQKRAAIRPGDVNGNVNGHLRLAHWCLRHDLLGSAARELADALDDDPTHPMIDLLERRLRIAIEPPPPRLPSKPTDRAPSPEELDRLVRGMPPGTVEAFTQTIQPLLINNCAAAGCHGPRPQSEFQLLRIPHGRPPGRRLTQRNLQAVLRWVDREDPAASRLLTASIRPHGTAEKAIFSEAQAAQYKRIDDWVNRVSKRPAPKVPETVAARQQPPARAILAELRGLDSLLPETSDAPGPQPADDSIFDLQEPAVPGPSVKRGAPLPVFVPVDPFDPEIFNRRYFGDK